MNACDWLKEAHRARRFDLDRWLADPRLQVASLLKDGVTSWALATALGAGSLRPRKMRAIMPRVWPCGISTRETVSRSKRLLRKPHRPFWNPSLLKCLS